MGKSITRKRLLISICFGIFSLFFLVFCGGNDVTTSPFAGFSAPVAEFSASPTTGQAPLTVAFSDLSTGVISTWFWDFGDGGTSTEQDPSHDFATAGTYTVSLTVTGPSGSDTYIEVDNITVNSPVFTDDFNREDADPIGGDWVTSPGQGSVAIASNQLKGSAEVAPGGGAYYNKSFDSNQYSQARIAVMSNVGVCVRMSATNRSYYRFAVINATTATLGKYVSGTWTQIGPDIIGTYGANDILRLEVSGSTLTCIQNGNVIRTDTDSSLTGGYPGVRFYTSVGSRLDDWEGGNLQ